MNTNNKVWIYLYTCCVTRAVHPTDDCRSIDKRFKARRGCPIKMDSDNAKIFKAAAKTI